MLNEFTSRSLWRDNDCCDAALGLLHTLAPNAPLLLACTRSACLAASYCLLAHSQSEPICSRALAVIAILVHCVPEHDTVLKARLCEEASAPLQSKLCRSCAPDNWASGTACGWKVGGRPLKKGSSRCVPTVCRRFASARQQALWPP